MEEQLRAPTPPPRTYSLSNYSSQDQAENQDQIENQDQVESQEDQAETPPRKPVWQPTTIVLGPGGIKGFLELGALLLLEKEGMLSEVRKYSGVSIGAILSLLLVAGYTVAEVINDALEVDLLQDISSCNFHDIQANVGLMSNRAVKERLSLRIREKFGIIPTLLQLYLAKGIFWEAVSLNLDKNRTEYLNKDTEPTLSCVDAALMSANIPLFFYQVEYKKCVHIDGAFGNPYPVDRHDDGQEQILGIYINTDRAETHIPVASNFILYLYRIIDSSMTQLRKRIIACSSSACKHLELYTDVIDTTGLSVTTETKLKLITDGYRSARKFLEDLINQKEVLIYDSQQEIETIQTSPRSLEL
jgi:predicted acylesterase/phospholipase RssA